ncbi:MAG: DUF547 domain-containing protein [Acidobacteria bacterium]|nr:DUF547 domain-containing protein [Acidobacteriota bacterium]
MSIKRKQVWIGIAFSVIIMAAAGGWAFLRPAPRLIPFRSDISVATRHPLTTDDYARVLKTYVNDQGLVNYKEMKAHSQTLDAFVHALGKLDSKAYDAWTGPEKIAFWINAYNALTLEAIIRHYPIHASVIRSVVFPKNSIRQIPGVWDKRDWLVMGRHVSLDDIEHETLRKQFHEPRIHMALVCASIGCPPLRNELYTGAQLDDQLDDQARRLLTNPQKFRIDRDLGRVYISPLFKWFGEDFVKTYGTGEKFFGHGQTERAVLNFVSRYLEARDRDYLAAGKYRVEYLDYDWSLNEPGSR